MSQVASFWVIKNTALTDAAKTTAVDSKGKRRTVYHSDVDFSEEDAYTLFQYPREDVIQLLSDLLGDVEPGTLYPLNAVDVTTLVRKSVLPEDRRFDTDYADFVRDLKSIGDNYDTDAETVFVSVV